MGFLVGSSAALSTWGKFRCVWCLQDNGDVTNLQDHDITYGSGQKSAADGSGLIRWRPRAIVFPFGDVQPSIRNDVYSNSPFLPPTWGNKISCQPLQVNASSPTGFESAAVTDELRAELNGDTVTFTDGQTTTIADILWQEGVYKWNGPLPPPIVDAGEVVSIGKFIAFS